MTAPLHARDFRRCIRLGASSCSTTETPPQKRKADIGSVAADVSIQVKTAVAPSMQMTILLGVPSDKSRKHECAAQATVDHTTCERNPEATSRSVAQSELCKRQRRLSQVRLFELLRKSRVMEIKSPDGNARCCQRPVEACA